MMDELNNRLSKALASIGINAWYEDGEVRESIDREGVTLHKVAIWVPTDWVPSEPESA